MDDLEPPPHNDRPDILTSGFGLLAVMDVLWIPVRSLTGRTLTPAMLLQWRRLARTFRRCGARLDLFRNIEYSFALEHLEPQSGERWLDVGSGDSPFLAHVMMQRPSVAVTANEIDPAETEKLKRRLDALGLATDNITFDARNLALVPPTENEIHSVNWCTLISTIEHFPGNDDVMFMRHLWSRMAPDGRVVVTVPALDYYEEKQPAHYHGMFERRYDPRAFYSRLQQNGFRVETIRYIRHGRGWLARHLARRHGDLNLFFRAWYGQSRPSDQPWRTLLLSLLLLEISAEPGPDVIGAMAVLRRDDKRLFDPIERIDRPLCFSLGDAALGHEGSTIILHSPRPVVHCRASDFVTVPVFVYNFSTAPLVAGGHDAGAVTLGVHLESCDGGESVWDYAHLPLPGDIAPGEGMLILVDLQHPPSSRRFRFVFDLVREGEFWFQERGAVTANVEFVVD